MYYICSVVQLLNLWRSCPRAHITNTLIHITMSDNLHVAAPMQEATARRRGMLGPGLRELMAEVEAESQYPIRSHASGDAQSHPTSQPNLHPNPQPAPHTATHLPQQAGLPNNINIGMPTQTPAQPPKPTITFTPEQEALIAARRAEVARELNGGNRHSARIEQLTDEVSPHLVDLSRKIPDPIPVLTHDYICIASEGNISAVVGEAKSKKTFLCTMLVGEYVREHVERQVKDFLYMPPTVLWVDTEQAESHVAKVAKRIHRMAHLPEGHNSDMLNVLTLREIEPKQRAEVLYKAMDLYRPKLVVVDGVSDLMYNTNDIEESDRIVGSLMAYSTRYNCHIMVVLHTNPNSDKARGHIGSTLQRKAESVLYVHKVAECSIVEPQFCRNEPFEPFAFLVTEEGLPEECEIPANSGREADDICVSVMRNEYPNGIERKVLTEKLVSNYGLSQSAARVRLSRSIKSGRLLCVEKCIYLP